jgi:hypothetical protein
MEALKSPLMGLLEKKRCTSFFQFVAQYDGADPQTYKGISPSRDTMRRVYEEYGLHPNTIDFIGHAIALYVNDEYLDKPCGPTLEKIKLYFHSISMLVYVLIKLFNFILKLRSVTVHLPCIWTRGPTRGLLKAECYTRGHLHVEQGEP